MTDPNDHFVALQSATLGRLEENDLTVPAPVAANGKAISFLMESKGDVASQIEEKSASVGIVAVVLTPTALLIDPNQEDLGMWTPVLVQVQEHVTVNRFGGTQVPALRLVSFILKRLQNFNHGLYVGNQESQRLKLDPKPFVLIRDDAPLTYNVAARAMLDLGAPLRS